MKSVLYTKYNKLRREEFRILTMICEDAGRRFVEKKALNPRAERQIKQIYENSLRIGEAYKNLDILIPEYKKDRVVFEYLRGQNLESDFVNYLDDFERLAEKISKCLEIITDVSTEYITSFQASEAYKGIFGEPWCNEGESASVLTNIDVLFDNIIVKEGHYICLDCEWVFDFPIPVKFVKYRCLFYFYQKYEAYLKRWKNLTDFLQIFNISSSEKEIFMNMERNFQIYVTGKDFENDYVYKYEKACKTLEEAYVDRDVAETNQRMAEIEINRLKSDSDQLLNNLNNTRTALDDCQRQLQCLEDAVKEKSQREDNLMHELFLKEQHVQNLTSYIESVQRSKWFQVGNTVGKIKKNLHIKKD